MDATVRIGVSEDLNRPIIEMNSAPPAAASPPAKIAIAQQSIPIRAKSKIPGAWLWRKSFDGGRPQPMPKTKFPSRSSAEPRENAR